MVPQPKRKHSSGRRDRRRAHDALSAMTVTTCSNCGEVRPAHTVCPTCGHYQGRQIVELDKEQKSK